MGLGVNTRYGIPVVGHTGSMIGYKSATLFLPDHGVGAVILTNSDTGGALLGPFQRRVLEVLFDGKPEAEADIAAAVKVIQEQVAVERNRLTVPADPAESAKLAPYYLNAELGDLTVNRAGGRTTFTIGKLSSEVASRVNPDGTVSFVTIVPGLQGLEVVRGENTLTLHDAQHQYVFKAGAREKPGAQTCPVYGGAGFFMRTSGATAPLVKADALAEKDREAAQAAADKNNYAAAARHWLACGRRYRGLADHMFAPGCFEQAIYAYAMAGRLQAEGRPALLQAAKQDPHNAREIYANLATPPRDCKVK
jgi:hypothetical protein